MAAGRSTTEYAASNDFAVRSQLPSILQLAFLYFLILSVSIAAAVILVNTQLLICILVLLVGGLGGYMLTLLQSARDTVLSTEFQNALFAGALDYNQTFCLILDKDGNIVYRDRSFQKMFPDFEKDSYMTLTGFLEHAQVADKEQSEVFDSLSKRSGDSVMCHVRGLEKRAFKLVLSLDPIRRPAGYVTLRAREYIEKRSGAAADGPLANVELLLQNKAQLLQLAAIMDRVHVGLYVVDMRGRLLYANAMLLSLLGIAPEAISDQETTLKDIMQYETSHPGAMTPDNFIGEVPLRKKAGGLIRSLVNQKLFHAEDHQPLGCLGLVQVTEFHSAPRMRLW